MGPLAKLSIVLLLAPALAWAEDVQPARATYLGAAESAEAADAASDLLTKLRPPVQLAEAPQHVDQLLPTGDPVVLGASSQRCLASPSSLADYRASLERLFQATLAMQDSEARYQQLRDTWSCIHEPVEPADLAQVAFLQGVAAHSDGQTEVAAQAFREVLVLHPDQPWDPRYPPAAHQVFQQAAAALAGEAHASLQLVVLPDTQVRIDGRLVPQGAERQQLAAGQHLLQIQAPGDEPLQSAILSLEPGAQALLLQRAALQAANAADLAPLFSFLQQEHAVPAYLVAAEPERRAWQWLDATKELQPLRIPKRLGGPILLASGATVTLAGALICALASYDLRQFEAGVESGELSPFPRPTTEEPSAYPLYQDWRRKTQVVTLGYGLAGTGSAAILASIPLLRRR